MIFQMAISNEESHNWQGWNRRTSKKLLNKGKSRKMTIRKFIVERSQISLRKEGKKDSGFDVVSNT